MAIDIEDEWHRANQALANSSLIKKIADERGWTIDFCQSLQRQSLLGWYKGGPAFPIRDTASKLVGIHYRINKPKPWKVEPSGTSLLPLVVGDLSTAGLVHGHESPWDEFTSWAVIDGFSRPTMATFATRGARNVRHVAGLKIPANATVCLWPQNDPSTNGQTPAPGEAWFAGVLQALNRRVIRVSTPPQYEDVNAWVRDGHAAAADLERAIANGQVIEPQPVDDEQRTFEELLTKYQAAICTSEDLETLSIKPREPLIGDWMREGDLGFVWGERGGGKTWFANALMTYLSTGQELFGWNVPRSVDVMFVDGEMPADAARDRLKALAPKNKRLHVLHHEVLFDRSGLVMNLTEARNQRILTEICTSKNVKLLVLDNLSCLFSGLPENDADGWELVLSWLLDLRRRRIAVLIIHHSSKAGTMRGTYRREDAAFWVIRVDPIKDRGPSDQGARFQTTFEKQRNSPNQEWTRKWTFQTDPHAGVSMSCEEISFDHKVLDLIEAGLHSASEIADELKTHRSTVCRAATRLQKAKLIEIRSRKYYSIRQGKP